MPSLLTSSFKPSHFWMREGPGLSIIILVSVILLSARPVAAV